MFHLTAAALCRVIFRFLYTNCLELRRNIRKMLLDYNAKVFYLLPYMLLVFNVGSIICVGVIDDPDLNGFEFCCHKRADDNLKRRMKMKPNIHFH